ncbi:hypothetical protein LEP1GSC061_3801 [Leptospira wolffii serovar Khorat str. Khorat-H2]|nr:hypothetical protein LEP1GSC061_3801 [Leptospira wolffii serovar Khorat str. Khorat-H2]
MDSKKTEILCVTNGNFFLRRYRTKPDTPRRSVKESRKKFRDLGRA